MNTIFFGEAARDSGKVGFSEAWPLHRQYSLIKASRANSPSCPHCMNVHTLGNVDDEFHIGVVVVVRAPRNLSKHEHFPPRRVIENITSTY